MPEAILPGTYVEVRDEGLISAGRISTGNIGIVGTASKGTEFAPELISSLSEAREKFGAATAQATLMRSLELIYQNGGRTVYAVCTGQSSRYEFKKTREGQEAAALTVQARQPGKAGDSITVTVTAGAPDVNAKTVTFKQATITETYPVRTLAELAKIITEKSELVQVMNLDSELQGEVPNNLTSGTFSGGKDADYARGLEALENETVNIVVLAGQDTGTAAMVAALTGHLKKTAGIKRERIGVMGVGFNQASQDPVPEDVPANDRLILVSPGIVVQEKPVSAGYLAAAVAGAVSALPVHTSPTNKTLVLEGLTTTFNSASLEKLVQSRVLAVEKRDGFRIVKGITTHDGAWQQITTRRIVDYAIYGVRSSCNPYIGKLNNVRVRGAMRATLDGFLTRMVESEALVGYGLEVSATRAQEIAGEAFVSMTLKPTFSIDFVKVTMYLS